MNHRGPGVVAFPVLETRRLVLREVRVSDAEDIFSFVGDPEFEKWNGGGVDDVETLAREIGESARDANGQWKILHRQVVIDWSKRLQVEDERDDEADQDGERGDEDDDHPPIVSRPPDNGPHARRSPLSRGRNRASMAPVPPRAWPITALLPLTGIR